MKSPKRRLSRIPAQDPTSQGAENILRRCLDLSEGQELLLIFDETTTAVAKTILKVAFDLGINPTALYADTQFQQVAGEKGELNLPFESCIRDSRAILTCVSSRPEYMPFRSQVVKSGMHHRKKVGHIPGASISLLRTAVNANYDEIVSLCDLLALVLVKGKGIELVTRDHKREEYSLKASIGGWDRMPVNSTGIIPGGAWGNIPGGETYISPIEGTAEGQIVIDGSIPGTVLRKRKGEEVILSFHRGKMVTIDTAVDAARRFFDDLESLAYERKDSNWSNLAEIGIGVNKSIPKLTGNPIIDEKKYGTAHIAIGRSKEFGGNVESSVHIDMITRSPLLAVDDIIILQKSQLVVDTTSWIESLPEIFINEKRAARPRQVWRTRTETRFKERKYLQRKWVCGAGRESYMDIGDKETAAISATVYHRIPPGRKVPFGQLLTALNISEESLLRALHVLRSYDLVNVI